MESKFPDETLRMRGMRLNLCILRMFKDTSLGAAHIMVWFIFRSPCGRFGRSDKWSCGTSHNRQCGLSVNYCPTDCDFLINTETSEEEY